MTKFLLALGILLILTDLYEHLWMWRHHSPVGHIPAKYTIRPFGFHIHKAYVGAVLVITGLLLG
jgi:hypothetical protein